MTLTVGIDVGGTKIEAGLWRDGHREPVEVIRRVTPTTGAQAVLDSVYSLVSSLANTHETPDSVGLGFPGIVDSERGTVHSAANLWSGSKPVAVAANLSDRIGVRVMVENDVRAAAYGAYSALVGANRALAEKQSLVYVGLGTGLAVGLVLNGRVYAGATGSAGEVGHVSFDGPSDQAKVCRCGRKGCLEIDLSGRAIGEAWDGASPATDLFDRAAAGEPRAMAVADRFVAALARLMVWMASTYDPAVIVLGGGAGASTPSLIDLLAKRLFRDLEGEGVLLANSLVPRIEQMGGRVGVYGAMLMAAESGGNP